VTALEPKRLLRAEMVRRGVTYNTLGERLGMDAHVLRNKVSRGGFSATFLLTCMAALGVSTLRLD
jgi:hypothetical protein